MRIRRLAAALAFAFAAACATAPADETPPDAAPAPTAPAATAPPPPAPTTSPPAPAPEPFDVWRRREPIYELYVRHFSPTGDFAGVEAKLPELKALGVGIVWLLPVNAIGSKAHIDAPHGNPYAVKDYDALNPEYGTDADLKRLVDKAHALGLHVIVDWVPNHTARDNPLVTQHPEWYARDGAGAIRGVDGFPWVAQLDWSKAALREWMATRMEGFVKRFGIDGFRVDFAHAMPVEFFSALRARLEKTRPVFLLAESGETRFHAAFDMIYDWTVYPVLGDVARGHRPTSAIDDALLHGQLIPYAKMPDALVMRMTYNHDDNGKFTLAERYGAGIKTFAVLSWLLPGKPLVFDGQEVGMRVFDGQTVRESINLGHDPKVKIDWSDPEGYRPFTTKLLRLFRANPALHQPGMADFRRLEAGAGTYAFVRRAGENVVVVVANVTDKPVSATLAPAPNVGTLDGAYVELFTDAQATLAAGATLALAPWAYRVYVRGPRDAP